MLSTPVPAIGSAKVNRRVEQASESEEFLFFLRVFFSIHCLLLSKRGAKVRPFFRLSQALSNFNFRRLLRGGTGSNIGLAAVKFLTVSIFCVAVAAAEPDTRLVIGSAKIAGISGVAKDSGQLLWGVDVAGPLLGRREV